MSILVQILVFWIFLDNSRWKRGSARGSEKVKFTKFSENATPKWTRRICTSLRITFFWWSHVTFCLGFLAARLLDVDIDTSRYLGKKLKATKDNSFGCFYLLYKIPKTLLKTRPVCSDCASTPHALGMLVEQLIVKTTPSYFKDSYVLAKLRKNLKVSKKWSIFSFDAISMYTNINTDKCLDRLAEFPLAKAKALVEDLHLVM